MAENVKNARRSTRISSKHQITIPASVLRKAGLSSGDRLEVVAVEAGRLTLARADDPVGRFAGALTGVYPSGSIDSLRSEWE